MAKGWRISARKRLYGVGISHRTAAGHGSCEAQQRSRVEFDAELIEKIATVAEEKLRDSDRRRIALAGCLQKLPEDQRALLAARYEATGSVNDLAKARQTTPKALSEMLRRLRQALLQCIERTLAQEAHA